MGIWPNAIGYQLVWIGAVIGTGRGLWWRALPACSAFVAAELAASSILRLNLKLIAVALVLDIVLDRGLAALLQRRPGRVGCWARLAGR